MDKKIILAIVAIVIIGGGIFILTQPEPDTGQYIGEEKAIEIFNNRNSTDDFRMVVAYGYLTHGSADGHGHGRGSVSTYSHSGYPPLDKVDSAKLTDFEGKKVYEVEAKFTGQKVSVYVYIDAVTGKFIK
ncbi:MAG: PepSY domain-containing protein [Methanobrevibacter sp.]|nr:PepSY domain-containing protein [Methanobrevibacter sp.]